MSSWTAINTLRMPSYRFVNDRLDAANTLLTLRYSPPRPVEPPMNEPQGPVSILPDTEMALAALAIMYAGTQDALVWQKMDAFKEHIEHEWRKKREVLTQNLDYNNSQPQEAENTRDCVVAEQRGNHKKSGIKRRNSTSSEEQHARAVRRGPKRIKLIVKTPAPPVQAPVRNRGPSSSLSAASSTNGISRSSPNSASSSAQSKKNKGAKDKRTRRPAPAETFGHNLKKFLNSLSSASDSNKASDFAPYEEIVAHLYPAIAQAPEKSLSNYDGGFSKTRRDPDNGYGGSTISFGLQQCEISLCQRMKITYAQYRTVKARLFIGLACFIEYNSRGLDSSVPKKKHQLPAATSLDSNLACQFRPVGFKVTQGQQVSKLDGNVTGPLTKIFHAWGWADEELVGNNSSSSDDANSEGNNNESNMAILDKWEERFPQALREEIFESLIEWEDDQTSQLEAEMKMAFRR